MIFTPELTSIFLLMTKTDTHSKGQWCIVAFSNEPWSFYALLCSMLTMLADLYCSIDWTACRVYQCIQFKDHQWFNFSVWHVMCGDKH